jgi:hypothetical protein
MSLLRQGYEGREWNMGLEQHASWDFSLTNLKNCLYRRQGELHPTLTFLEYYETCAVLFFLFRSS